MYELEINGHKISKLAGDAITLLESVYGFKMNETQRYFLGKEIMIRSGVYHDLEVKETSKYIEKQSKSNGL